MLGAFKLNSIAKSLGDAYPTIVATGGTITTPTIDGVNYAVHTFTSSGSFIVSSVSGNATADFLLVGGGGAGGYGGQGSSGFRNAGGGGGGAVRRLNSQQLSSATFSVTVGDAGTSTTTSSSQGGQSNIIGAAISVAAMGGGYGGWVANSGSGNGQSLSTSGQGTAGAGSGAVNTQGGTAGTGGTNPYGYSGGNSYVSGTSRSQGGSGGSSSAGTNGTAGVAGVAGSGTTITDFFSKGSVVYGAGYSGFAATGGVVTNSTGSGQDATLFSGNGGGGASGTGNAATPARGGFGGGGIVAIRYPLNSPTSLVFWTYVLTTTQNITMPTVQAGDLAIYINTGWNSNNIIPTLTTPSGWTSLSTFGNNTTTCGASSGVFYKICNGTEGGTTITGISATTTNNTILIYRPDKPINFVTVPTTATTRFTDSAPSSSILSMNTVSGPYIGMFVVRSTGNVFPPGYGVSGATQTKIISPSGGVYNGPAFTGLSTAPAYNTGIHLFESLNTTTAFASTTMLGSDVGNGNYIAGLVIKVA